MTALSQRPVRAHVRPHSLRDGCRWSLTSSEVVRPAASLWLAWASPQPQRGTPLQNAFCSFFNSPLFQRPTDFSRAVVLKGLTHRPACGGPLLAGTGGGVCSRGRWMAGAADQQGGEGSSSNRPEKSADLAHSTAHSRPRHMVIPARAPSSTHCRDLTTHRY